MKALHYSCQGESHKATDKVCQDYSYSEVSDRLAIAIVCDGHGGKRYFRSDVGAQYATEITKECVAEFIEGVGDELFKGKAFTQVSALNTEIKNDNFDKKTKVDVAMRQLFSSIIYRWREKILEHANANPLSDAERSTLDSRYVTDFEKKDSLEKTYGCTLMCYAQTPDYWLAFHVGDGKCIAFDCNGEWSEPIPWDERCFLNKTTSLCDSEALDEFRYCYQGDGEFPVIVFLGSDGIDDSFGETTNMVNFYAQVAKMLANDSFGDCINSIQTTLPELSARGSQDDMSIACVYDELKLDQMVCGIVAWQQRSAHEAIAVSNQRIEQLLNKYNQFEGKNSLSRSEQIDLRYTVTELKRAYQNKRDQAKKYDRFSQEIGGDFEPYNDEYGFGEQLVLIAEQKLEEQMARDVTESKESTEITATNVSENKCDEIVLSESSSTDNDLSEEDSISCEDTSLPVVLNDVKADNVETQEKTIINDIIIVDNLPEEVLSEKELTNEETQTNIETKDEGEYEQ